MSLETGTQLSVETMSDIAHLATRVSKPMPMSVQEMNVEAAKIAEEAGIVVGDVLFLVLKHVNHRSHGHSSGHNEAYASLTRFRGNKM